MDKEKKALKNIEPLVDNIRDQSSSTWIYYSSVSIELEAYENKKKKHSLYYLILYTQ